MSKSSIVRMLFRGLGLGLLITFINGFSLPFLMDIFSRILKALNTGVWYSGPYLVLELWLIFFISGILYSFFPSMILGGLLVFGIQSLWSEKMHRIWHRICVGMALGCTSAVCYVLLMFQFDPFYTEPIVNLQEHSLLVVFIFVEQLIIYSWLAARLSISG